MEKVIKKIGKILIYIFLLLIFTVVLGIVLGEIYKNEIKNYVITSINKEIDVKVSVSAVDVSAIRKFPFMSIVLNDVVALSSKDFEKSEFSKVSVDTLFTAQQIFLQFNLVDILQKNYRLKKIHALNGKLIILIDKKGNVNYRILKNAGFSSGSEDFALGLDGVKISGFSWQFLNNSKEIYSQGLIKDLALKGMFSQSNFTLSTISEFFIKSFRREGIEYASRLNVISGINMEVQDSVYKISKGKLILNDLIFKAGGSFVYGNKTTLDFQIGGERLNIASLISILPFNTSAIKKYSPSGKADVLAKIKGTISSIIAPSIKAAFKISNAKLLIAENGKFINGINLQGTFSNGSQHNAITSRINLSSFSIEYGNNKINGKLSLDNFVNPFLSADLKGTIIARDLSDILAIKNLNLKEGFIYPNLSLNLNLTSANQQIIKNLSLKGIDGEIEFKGINGETPLLVLDVFEGNIRMEGEIWFPVLNIKMGQNIISTDLMVKNLPAYFLTGSAIPEVSGEISAKKINVTEFLQSKEISEETEFHMPDSLYFKIHCRADSLIYGKFAASHIETWTSYKPGLLSISSLKMNSIKGSGEASAVIIEDANKKMLVKASGNLKKIDIQKLFYSCNNFGQDFIISDNLRGSGSGTFNLSAEITDRLELETKNLTAESDFVIENGELINFEPITKLSDYIELSELQHIKFLTLKNSVIIKDEKVYIPQMDINSSAFNITISGIHGFDNQFDYKLRISLDEILSKKVKRTKSDTEEFGVIEDDGYGKKNLYLTIVGNPDDYKIHYDRKEVVNRIKTNLQEEKKVLRTILKEDLGLFKKDTVKVSTKKTTSKFIMDWEDENIDSTVVKGKSGKAKKKDPAFDITWDE